MKNTQYFDSSNTMQMYMEEIGKIPLLSADDEIRLFNQMRNHKALVKLLSWRILNWLFILLKSMSAEV